ncbi:MAG: cytochrome c family protein [Proteobacteria bacterium]|nr:cytochrome c family protein [Pseudomonadota bacterium]
MSRHLLGIAAALALFAGASAAHAADLKRGANLAKLCAACHSLTDASNKIGPSLAGVIGRPMASVEGFTYSQAMKDHAAKDGSWDEAKLVAYLEDPRKTVPGTTMAFGGLKKLADRENIVAYLATLAPAP